ncbi:hypothetical protein Q9966_016045 [Columba livia]|nr:hypothetical protein Q9966_016045 [Columba livia]
MAFPQPRPVPPELPRRRLRTLECGQGAVRAVRFNADGNYCLTCGADKTLKLWNPRTGVALKSYQGHGYEVLDAAGSPDNSALCSGSADRTVALWDVATGRVLRKFRGHAGKVNCVRFNEEATVIVSGSDDGSVRCWDGRSRRAARAAGAARGPGRRHQRRRGPRRHPGGLGGRARAQVRPAGRAAALRLHRQPREQRLPQPGRSERVGRQSGLGAAAAGHAERGAAGGVPRAPQRLVPPGLRPERQGRARGGGVGGRTRLPVGPAGGVAVAASPRGSRSRRLRVAAPGAAAAAGGHQGAGAAVGTRGGQRGQ